MYVNSLVAKLARFVRKFLSKLPWPIGHTPYYSCCAAKQDENCKRNLHKNFLASLTSTTELLTHSVHVHLTYSITCSRLLAILKPATFQAIKSKKSNTLYMYSIIQTYKETFLLHKISYVSCILRVLYCMLVTLLVYIALDVHRR